MCFKHIPVLVKEVLDNIISDKKVIYVDCTLGEGGHAFEILKNSNNSSFLFGIDQDEESIRIAKQKFKNNFYENSFNFIKTNFINIKEILNSKNIFKVDRILYDLGFVANQIYSKKRGFSYKNDEILDMRMDKEQFLTAEKILNNYSKFELKKIFIEYGEQKYTEKIVSNIIKERKLKPIKKSGRLVNIIKYSLPKKIKFVKHPGRKIFQALRIAVNNELVVLEESLKKSIDLLKIDGKILIISYHSLEDRIVKRIFNLNKNIRIITKKPIVPSQEEVLKNRQSRSAKLRIAIKINEK